jgi:hypothetical protein
MRDPERIDRITKKLNRLWKENPDWRFVQFLINSGLIVDGPEWFIEDDLVEKRLDELNAE